MTSPRAKRLLTCVGALLLTGAVSHATQAGCGFYRSAYYGPTPYSGSYYAAYAPTYYGVGYRGWGASYATYYAPSYSRFACTSCYNPCGTTCGIGCGTCGVAYGACGIGCGTCGLASCYGCGVDCGTGITTPADASQNEPYTGQDSAPRTYGEDGATEPEYQPPTPQPDSAGSSGGVFPGGGQGQDEDFGGVDRGVQKPPSEETIQQRPGTTQDDAELTDEPPVPDVPESDEDAGVEPADIDDTVAVAIAPSRTRARYTVRFRAPRIARIDVTPNRQWTPVETHPQLAADFGSQAKGNKGQSVSQK